MIGCSTHRHRAGPALAARIVALVAITGMLLPLGNAEHSASAAARAKCKVVTKKVNGKKRRVRVCRKPKPGLPSAGTVVAAISLPAGAAPAGLLALPGAIWVAGHRSDSIFRIDPASNSIVARVRVTRENIDQPSFMAYGNGTLFVVDYGGGTVALVDPVHNSLEKFATSPSENGFWPVFAAGSLWLVGRAGIVRMDPSGQVSATLVPGPDNGGPAFGFAGLAFGAESIWGAVRANSEVFRLDPVTNQLTARIATSAVPSAFGAGSVWGIDSSFRNLVRIDPTSNSVSATIPLPALANPPSLTATDTAVWVAEGGRVGSHIWKIDPTTNRVVGVINTGHASSANSILVGGDGSIWVSLFYTDLVLRVQPK
jgi:streptogramin lyase